MVLSFTLSNNQIQLITYTYNTPKTFTSFGSSASLNPSPPSPSLPGGGSVSKGADGYYAVADFASNKQISLISSFVTQSAKIGSSSYKLTGVAFTNSSRYVTYRLSYQILGYYNLVQDVYVQMISPNSYQIISSNYSNAVRPALARVNLNTISTDSVVSNINTIIISTYNNILGAKPTLVDIMTFPPYYQLTYRVDQYNYAFFVMYDYL